VSAVAPQRTRPPISRVFGPLLPPAGHFGWPNGWLAPSLLLFLNWELRAFYEKGLGLLKGVWLKPGRCSIFAPALYCKTKIKYGETQTRPQSLFF
jgi:hypothetical protein